MVCSWVLYPRTGYNQNQHFNYLIEMLVFLCLFLALNSYLFAR
jgi:hypothetical protein